MSITQEMKKSRLSFNVNCYNVMIDKHCHLNNLHEAVCLFKEMKDKGVGRNTVTYIVIIRDLCHHGYKEKAVEVF